MLGPSLLTGCRRGSSSLLLATKGGMPSAWVEALPSGWGQELMEGSAAVQEALAPSQIKRRAALALASLPDG